MKRGRGPGRLVWAGALAAGGAVVGYAALRTEDGRALDENLFKAANAEHRGTAGRFFAGITELGSLYAARAPAPWRARARRGCSSRVSSASWNAPGPSSRTRRARAA